MNSSAKKNPGTPNRYDYKQLVTAKPPLSVKASKKKNEEVIWLELIQDEVNQVFYKDQEVFTYIKDKYTNKKTSFDELLMATFDKDGESSEDEADIAQEQTGDEVVKKSNSFQVNQQDAQNKNMNNRE